MTAISNTATAGATAAMHAASTARPATSAAERVVIAGAGPTGMALALDLARRGIPSMVVEAHARDASRGMLLNIAPGTIDQLAKIGATDAIARMQPITHVRTDSLGIDGAVHASVSKSPITRQFQPQPSHAVGSMDTLLGSIKGQDERPWGRIRISDLENSLRSQAERDYPHLIQTIYQTKVTAVQELGDGVKVTATGRDGATQALDGAYFVSATGGRNALGVERRAGGPKMYFAGGEFPGTKETTTRILREQTPDGQRQMTIGLRNGTPSGHSLAWVQVHEDPKTADPVELKSELVSRAKRVGMGGGTLSDTPIPVTVQLGAAAQARVGRSLLIGDETLIPYFPNSTGANKGIMIDACQAADTLGEVMLHGVDHDAAFAAYEKQILASNGKLLALNNQSLHDAIGGAHAVRPS